MTRLFMLLLFVAAVGCQPAPEETPEAERATVLPSARVHYLEQLTQDEIDALDREKSVFFLTFGNLEEHGPHLPVGSDYYRAMGIRDRLINRLHDAHSDYHLVIFPVVPIGVGGANKHTGGFMAFNGLIYTIPRDANSVLIIDPQARGVFTENIMLCGYYNTF